MHFTSIFTVLAAPAIVLATLDTARSHTPGAYPRMTNCEPQANSTDIQAAECFHNTRVKGQQTFAVFSVNQKFKDSHGAPYGSCAAYTCESPTSADMVAGQGSWTFFWVGEGKYDANVQSPGCIKSPKTGDCGCENSDGKFIPGGTNCK